jgi:protoporphyrinogen oxidase
VKVAVIGAGMAGLTAAHRLVEEGHECDVYERWPGLGGQVATLDVGGGTLLERYYHHLFTSDRHIAALYRELGMDDAIEWIPSSVAMFRDGESYPFNSPTDLLRFKPLSLRSRLRMGWAVLMLQLRAGDVTPFESITAKDWILDRMGTEVWEKVWGPLLRGKFGDHAERISMAWLWARLTVRRRVKGKEARQEVLGYPRGGWQPLLERLRESVERSGSVRIDRPVRSLGLDGGRFALEPAAPDSFRRGHDPREFPSGGASETYDAVIATVPNPVFRQMLSDDLAASIGPEYIGRLDGIEYDTALCVLLELDRPFGRFYWTNIADPAVGFLGLIEQTNLIGPERYDGRHYLYVANYVAPDDPLLGLDYDELLAAYEPGLRRLNAEFDRSWVRQRWVFREPDAQPIVTVGYPDRMPPLATGVPGLVLANTTQVYPEDRGTNYAVELGERAVRTLLTDTASPESGSV